MSDVTTHAERIRRYMILRRGERLSHARGEIQEGHIDREWDEAEAALDALLEENATLRATKDRVDEECVLYGLTHSDGEAYGIEGLLKHIYANRDITIGMERHLADLLKEKMEAAEALVVSLTEQRDALEGAYQELSDVHTLGESQTVADNVQLREALSEIDLETTAGGLPFDKLVEIGRMARAALAAGVPSTPPDQPDDPWVEAFGGSKEQLVARLEGMGVRMSAFDEDEDEDLGDVGDARVTAKEASDEE